MKANVPHSELTFAQANGIEIAYDTFGNDRKPPMLLIMGLGTQMIVWDEAFCSQLASKGYWVIRFDNRDIGLSTKFKNAGVPNLEQLEQAVKKREPFEIPYTLLDMAEDAVGLLDALGSKTAHIVGESMGAMIGQLMAVHYPERVISLTSIMSTTGQPGLPPPSPDALEAIYEPWPIHRTGYVETFVQAYRVLSGPEIKVDKALARKWAEQSYDRGLNPDGIARQLAAIIASGNRSKKLKSITAQTLVIHGEADPLLPVEHGRATADAIPRAKLTIIPGMGHTLPEALWPKLVEAISQHAV
jgi:pimeloyl-ACP methyl ester carboxylesterase